MAFFALTLSADTQLHALELKISPPANLRSLHFEPLLGHSLLIVPARLLNLRTFSVHIRACERFAGMTPNPLHHGDLQNQCCLQSGSSLEMSPPKCSCNVKGLIIQQYRLHGLINLRSDDETSICSPIIPTGPLTFLGPRRPYHGLHITTYRQGSLHLLLQ